MGDYEQKKSPIITQEMNDPPTRRANKRNGVRKEDDCGQMGREVKMCEERW